jgi:FtsZ-binding cell division protein ZapB
MKRLQEHYTNSVQTLEEQVNDGQQRIHVLEIQLHELQEIKESLHRELALEKQGAQRISQILNQHVEQRQDMQERLNALLQKQNHVLFEKKQLGELVFNARQYHGMTVFVQNESSTL